MDRSPKAFESSLRPLVDEGLDSGPLAVDLDDLMVTAERLSALLLEITRSDETWSLARLKSKLFQVQILVSQDLPMIFKDVLPPLERLSGEILECPESKDSG